LGSYRDLVAWKQAMELVTEVYRLTESFPQREMYGLTRQIREAAVSVPSNIAEGRGRRTTRDYLSFLYRARGSLFETETQMDIARNLGYLPEPVHQLLREGAAAVARPLNGLIASLERRLDPDRRPPTADRPDAESPDDH